MWKLIQWEGGLETKVELLEFSSFSIANLGGLVVKSIWGGRGDEALKNLSGNEVMRGWHFSSIVGGSWKEIYEFSTDILWGLNVWVTFKSLFINFAPEKMQAMNVGDFCPISAATIHYNAVSRNKKVVAIVIEN